MNYRNHIDVTGFTYVHEHLHVDLSGVKNNIDCRLDQFDFLLNELKSLYALGVRNIVEVTNRYMGRNATFLLSLSEQSQINILASTGYYQQKFYPDHIDKLTVEEIAKELIDEIEIGIDGTSLKASVIAEIGSSLNVITADEKKVFTAAAVAHQQTKRPISTHTTLSTMGLEQFELLSELGVPAEHIVIGHCDLRDNLEVILPIAEAGGYVQFDTIGKNDYYPDTKRIEMLKVLQAKELLTQVMLSMDITRRSHLSDNGGIGFSYLLTDFVPMLFEAGFTNTEITLMLKDNPNRFFK